MLLPPPQNNVAPQFRAVPQDVSLYSPNTGAVVDAYVDEAFHGVGTLAADFAASDVRNAKGTALTADEYTKSEFFREGVQYYGGMTDGAAKTLAKYHDERAANAEIIGRASTAQSAFGITAAIGAGVLEPKNLALGIATGGVLGLGRAAVMSTRAIVAAKRANSGYATALRMGAIDGLVSAAVAEPSNRYSAHTLQQDYTMADSLFNVATSTILGSALHAAPKFIKDRFSGTADKVKAYDTTLAEIDTATAQLSQGKRVDVGHVDIAAKATEIPKQEAITSENLHKVSKEELQTMLSEKTLSDEEKLVKALGVEGAAEFKRLNRKANSAVDMKGADAAYARLAEIESSLSPEQMRLIYGIGEENSPQADDIKAVLTAHEDLLDASNDELGRMAMHSLRNVSPEEIKNVPSQGGSPTAQAAFIRIGRIYQELKSRGIKPNDIPEIMIKGASPYMSANDAASFIGDFLEASKGKPNRLSIADATSSLRKAVTDDLDPDNDTAIDHAAAQAVETYESIELDADETKALEGYMQEIAQMKRDGVLNEADEAAMNDAFENVREVDIKRAWEAAYICLTRG